MPTKKASEKAEKTLKAGAKAPAKKTAAAKKPAVKATTKPAAAKKTAAKKPAPAKTPAPAKPKAPAAAKKSAATPKAAKPAAVKKPVATKIPAAVKKAVTAKKPAAPKKAPAKKPAAAKKPAVKKPAARTRTPARKPAKAKALPERKVKPESEITAPSVTEVREHYFHEHRDAHFPPSARDLPDEYGDTRIVLLVRDPEWLYAYWEINDATRAELDLPRTGHNRRMVVRMYNINGRNWPAEAAHYFYDVDVSPFSNNWYIRVNEPESRWCAELGMIDEDRNYICIARSNVVATPSETMSPETDTEWMVVEETYRKLYDLGGGYAAAGERVGGSEELLRHIQKQVLPGLKGEAVPGSAAFGGASRAAAQVETAKAFWLQVHTELILYGATEPDATVTVQGRPVKLYPDGTFSMRFALPDGEQSLPVRASNKDGDMTRVITPVVKKTTR
jgi:hypothetical protein